MKKPEIWIIQHKVTKEIWKTRSGGKSSWRAKGHAKSAWAGSRSTYGFFDDQDEYEVVNLYNYAKLEQEYNELLVKHAELLEAYNELSYRMEGLEK